MRLDLPFQLTLELLNHTLPFNDESNSEAPHDTKDCQKLETIPKKN